jgi:AraC-like DNA-binding protein
MKTQTILPPLSIAGYVSSILVIENRHIHPGFVLPLFANGCPTIVFQTVKASKGNQAIGNLTLYGQTVQPDALAIKENFTLIAYFLYPQSLKSLFGLSAAEFTDKCIDLNFLKLAREPGLQERLLNASSLNERLQLMNGFILKLSGLNNTDDRKIVFATNKIRKSNGLYPLTGIQKDLNVSERTFQRLFESNIGISPKMYRRICQFNSSFQQLNQNRFFKLSDIAYDNGFVDQSHFIRVFKEFTNLTPKEYLNRTAIYFS